MSFKDFETSKVRIKRASGGESDVMPCQFSKNKVTFFRDSLDLEEDDKIVRLFPDGKEKSYAVSHVEFSDKFHSIPAHFTVTVVSRRSRDGDIRGATINVTGSQNVVIGGSGNRQIICDSLKALIEGIDNADI